MTLEEIRKKAEELADKYNHEGLSPFPYEKIIADNDNLQIFFVETPAGVSGAIWYDKTNKKYKILINKNNHPNRQNFTIAHELGHYFLHLDHINSEELLIDEENSLDSNSVLFRLDTQISNKIEREANNFAASLIMPERLIRDAWLTIKNVEECSKIFNVSVSAMSIRLEKLGLI